MWQIHHKKGWIAATGFYELEKAQSWIRKQTNSDDYSIQKIIKD